jgi:hypothetical protein
MNVNRKLKIMVALGAVWVAVCAVVAGAADANTEHRTPNIQHRTAADLTVRPTVAVRGGGWEAGVSFGWAWGPGGHGKRNTEDGTRDAAGRTAYVERAVPLWRASPGELVAAAGSGVADINAVVQARDEAPRIPVEWPAWRRGVAHVGRHLEYRKTEYVAGGAVGLVATAIGIAIDQSRDDSPAPAPTVPLNRPAAETTVAGDGNSVQNTYRMPPGTIAPETVTTIHGNNNTVVNSYVIEEAE